jgi:CHASE2 domain-containing sensor protein/serine phosphatase RsbU (regulator of sigma subunit)
MGTLNMKDNAGDSSQQPRGSLLRTILILTPVMAGLVILGSALGIFRALEWATQDQFFILKAQEPQDDRITIVTIDESDIQYVGRWPMPDAVFAEAIRNIRAKKPVAIGIDIYRDLPVEPGHEELVDVFKTTPNLIGIQKIVGNPIDPPPDLAERQQVAANDLVLDLDNKARRGLVLLATGEDDGALLESFGARLALTYLGEKNLEFTEVDLNWAHHLRKQIEDQRLQQKAGSIPDRFLGGVAWLLPDWQWIYQLGKARLIPLSSRDGDYNGADMGGYQVLLNYRSSTIDQSFQTISLQNVLENKIPAGLLNDRLVFVGAKAPSLNDNFATPYNSTLQSSAAELMPGVAIHATVASQIISAALDGRPLLRTSPKLLNWLLILLWSGYSVTIGTLCVRQEWMSRGIISIVLATGVIIVIGYVAFQSGWLVPVFTPLVALSSAGIVSIGTALWTNLKLSYQQLEEYAQTLEDKVNERTAELASANDEISKLNDELTDENRRMGAELNVAKEMQQLILPKTDELEAIEGLDISGFMEPADEVGGDYYDVLSENGLVTLSIGDVTGHGLESGILMIMTQTAVRTLQEAQENDPVRFLDVLNRTIYKNVQRMESDKSLTLVVLNYQAGILSISGQHEETLVVRADGTVERVDTMDLGFPIGLIDEIADTISQQSFRLAPNEGVVLYTDGVTEAENLAGEQYGLDRLCEVITSAWDQSAEDIKQAIIDDVRDHIGEQKVFDDISLLVVKRNTDDLAQEDLAHPTVLEVPALVPLTDDLSAETPEDESEETIVSTDSAVSTREDLESGFAETFGEFREDFDNLADEEFLELGFSPTSKPIQNRWRNHGLSADFVADYLSTFLPISEDYPQNEDRQVLLKSSVSYIANELLENSMKFNDHQAYTVQFGIRLFLEAEELRVILTASNSLSTPVAQKFKNFIREFLSQDPNEFYLNQMEASAEDDTGTVSGLGLVTMVTDHNSTLGWKFETVSNRSNPEVSVCIVTTMVQISV